MTEPDTKIRCDDCERDHEISRLDEESCCPDCGKQLLFFAGQSRGSAAEAIADRRAEATTEEEEDFYRTLLHLLACNLLTKYDMFHFIAMGRLTDNLQHVLGDAIENAETTEGGDILVCPNCDDKIKSWARWYTADEST